MIPAQQRFVWRECIVRHRQPLPSKSSHLLQHSQRPQLGRTDNDHALLSCCDACVLLDYGGDEEFQTEKEFTKRCKLKLILKYNFRKLRQA